MMSHAAWLVVFITSIFFAGVAIGALLLFELPLAAGSGMVAAIGWLIISIDDAIYRRREDDDEG